jgi:hypothetical protein
MQTPAATVVTRTGRMGYGPKCAQAMGIMPSRLSVTAKRRPVTHTAPADERQADWIGEPA